MYKKCNHFGYNKQQFRNPYFKSTIPIGILNLRLLGYYKIRQGVLQQHLSKYYEFELAKRLCDQYNNLINTLKKEQSADTGEKYPWLEDSDRRKHMTDREC